MLSRDPCSSCLGIAILTPSTHICRIVQEHASVLDAASFEKALQEAERLLPGLDIGELLNKSPDMVLQFQSGSTMIQYDPVPGQE